MATTYVDIQDRYFIKTDNTNDIRINVIIGDGQTGAYVIFEDKKLKAANKSANLKAANKLVGKRCLVAATIVDMMNAPLVFQLSSPDLHKCISTSSRTTIAKPPSW